MREFEKVIVPEFPNITGLKAWMSQLCQNVVAAASKKNDGPVAEWFHKAGTATCLEELDESPGWIKSIDMKLYHACSAMLRNSGSRGQEVVYRVDRMVASGYDSHSG